MDEPVNYRHVADYLAQTRGLPSVDIRHAVPVHLAGQHQRPSSCSAGVRTSDLPQLIDRAWDYERAPDDPRIIWYPG